jgi:two-component system chemotaxis response regulator CheY
MDTASERIGLYSIGRLSKMVAVTVDALRYYDEIGLFKPAYTDRDSGYRYYTASQAAELNRILELKGFGYTLNEIKRLLLLSGDGRALMAAYQNRYWQLINEEREKRAIIEKLSEKIKQGQEETVMGNRILLVDDAPFMRLMCKDILNKAGYEICGEAADGEEAVRLCRTLKPDLLVVDIVMPKMDGIYALQQIRAFDGEVKAVMLSAMGQARIVAEALLSGAEDFVVKPFQADRLIEAAARAFTEQCVFNRNVLEQIRDKCAESTFILSQTEIDDIIKAALTGSEAGQQTDALIKRLQRTSNPYGEGYAPAEPSAAAKTQTDDTQTDSGEILALLKQIVKGQDEMKELLGTLAGK